MSQQVYIDYVLIPDDHIIAYPVSEEQIEFNRDKLCAATMELELINIDQYYSKWAPVSILYGSDYYNKPCQVYDTELGIYTWQGRIKAVVSDDRNKTVTVKSSNFVRDMVDTVLEYVSSAAVTPAERIHYILATVLEIDSSFIQYGGFADAIAIQDAASVYCDMNYDKEANVTCLTAIEELLRITSCHLYTIDNIIRFWQWRAWAGQVGTIIKSRRTQNFTSEPDDGGVVNDYSIAYKSGASVAYQATDYPTSLTASRAKFGTRSFLVPDEEVDSTTPEDFRILLQSAAAAQWCGNLKISRNSDMIETFRVQVDYDYGWLHVNDQVDLNEEGLVNEPGRVTAVELDRDNRTLEIQGEFLNLPVNRYSRDTLPPNPVILVSVFPSGRGKVFLKWSASLETDHVGYYVYFTATPGMWEQEYSHLGRSPVEVKNPSATYDGYVGVELRELLPGVRYYFKVTSFDTRYNESEDSNVLSAVSPAENFNAYRVTGVLYSVVSLDITNPRRGTVPDRFTTFTDLDSAGPYDPLTAGIESPVLRTMAGVLLVWRSFGDVVFQSRVSDDGITWGDWVEELSSVQNKIIPAGYYQFAFIFRSPFYTAVDDVQLITLEEVA